MNGDGPDFMERINPLVARADGKRVFDTERDLLLVPFQIHHFAKLDSAEILCLIPEIDFLSVEAGLRPGKVERMLMGMIGREVAGDLLPGGGVNRVNVSAPAEMRFNAFGDRLLRLDVFQHGLVAQGDADRVICFRKFKVAAENGLEAGAERTGEQENKELGRFHWIGFVSKVQLPLCPQFRSKDTGRVTQFPLLFTNVGMASDQPKVCPCVGRTTTRRDPLAPPKPRKSGHGSFWGPRCI